MKNAMVVLFMIMWIDGFSQNWILESNHPATFDRRAGISVVVGNKAYIGLGIGYNNNGTETVEDFWSYDMITKTWFQLPSLPGGPTHGPRCGASAFAIGTNIYVGGGDLNVKSANPNAGYYVSDFWVFDTTNSTWSQIASLPAAMGESLSFTLNGKGYVTCGQRENGNGHSSNYVNLMYCYDPTTDQWTQKYSFPGTARSYPVGFVIGSKAYVGGGYNGFWDGSYPSGITPAYYSDFYSYDPTTDAWTALGTITNGFDGSGVMAAAVGFSTCDKGYLVFGNVDPWNGTNINPAAGCSNKVMEYDPVNNSWSVRNITTFNESGNWMAI